MEKVFSFIMFRYRWRTPFEKAKNLKKNHEKIKIISPIKL